MTEADLARPVVDVRDFETGKLEYEIYSYGEENVIIPITEVKESPIERLAKATVQAEVSRFDRYAEVEIVGGRATVKVANEAIPKIIGKEGRTIKELEARLGIAIDIQPRVPTLGREVPFETKEAGGSVLLMFPRGLIGKTANVYIADRLLFSATVGKKAQIRVDKGSEVGREFLAALVRGAVKAYI
jgi:ATPase